MPLQSKQVFIRKTANQRLYKWSPSQDNIRRTSSVVNIDTDSLPQQFCNATPYGVDGIDNVTKYVGEPRVIDGVKNNLAYVACDYVQ